MGRYSKNIPIDLGKRYSTSYIIPLIRQGIKEGRIRYEEVVLREGERLDTIAGKKYGKATDFWIIAAASNIGFSIQAPPGTLLKVPLLEDIELLSG